MKRKLFTALVIVSAVSFTACSEDAAMEELIQDTELDSSIEATGNGDGDDDKDGPGGN